MRGVMHDPLNILNTYLVAIIILIIGIIVFKKYEHKVAIKF